MGVFVVGMHRSGTSALARLVKELGLFPGEASELMAATEDNAAGYIEVTSLTRQNDTLLAGLGGSALAPPVMARNSEADMVEFRAESALLFESVFRDTDWVWKDPRNCLLLPFWLSAIGGNHAAVMIYRTPTEVAGSLVKRDAISYPAALALWELYVRESLVSVRSLPVYVTSYESLLACPSDLAEKLSDFLGSHGIATAFEPSGDFGIDNRLRHQVRGVDDSLSPSQVELLDTLDSLEGEHASFDAPVCAPMGAMSAALLEERRISVGQAEKSRHLAEVNRVVVEDALSAASRELDHRQTILDGLSDELDHRQSVIDGLLVELDSRSGQVNDAATEVARWRASVDRLAAECDIRDRRLAEVEQDLETALARIHTRAGSSG